MSLLIACSLSDSELQERRGGVLQRVRRAVVQVKELETGYAYGFPADRDWLTELAKLVEFEHQCCPFLRFSIIVEPDDGSVWLEMSGPQGVKEFIAATFTSEAVL